MRIFVIIIVLFLVAPATFSQSSKKEIRKGNRNYKSDEFAQSELNYKKSIDIDHESFKARFNLGDALYRQDRYKEAVESFGSVASSEGAQHLNSSTYYNMGNSYAMAGRYDDAIEAYKNSLRADPANHAAKYNLTWAMDQKKKDQEQDKKDQDQQKEDQKEQDKKNEKQKNNPDDNGQPKDNKSGDQQKMQKADAERVLAALSANDEKVRDKVNRDKAAAAKVKTKINW